MICYGDRTFCNAGVLCKTFDCNRRLTQDIVKAAKKAKMLVSVVPWLDECFVPFFSDSDAKRRAAQSMSLKDVGNVHDIKHKAKKRPSKDWQFSYNERLKLIGVTV